MTILSDKRIRALCEKEIKPMISPFEPSLIKQNETGRVISFGTSSYGYDIRCADEFKVFTNINSTIVDPKAFNEDNFVEVSGKGYCIIPPNSFALGRTVERFCIPRNILTICLGKSTYARCFSGDTQVYIVGHGDMSFLDIIAGMQAGNQYKCLSKDSLGKIRQSPFVMPSKISTEIPYTITFDTGNSVVCTYDHQFYLQGSGTLIEARDLTVGTQLQAVNPENNNYMVLTVTDKTLGTEAIDTYCMNVPMYGNFVLSNGLLVKNCGLIVNVTPFEPEWEGYVTLEFSNTTPLPAKIYANEGIAQVIFLESDDVCETSYADRGGKYMNQEGVVTPKL